MLSGINTDIPYNGTVYHVQTEDGGVENPVITTILFCGGAIRSTKKNSYKDVLQSDSLNDIIREMMKEQHKAMIRELAAGKYDRYVDSASKLEPSSANATPPGEKKKKSLDDMILDYLSDKEDT
jgi:hypothetical protein